jgi:hypothetical protein
MEKELPPIISMGLEAENQHLMYAAFFKYLRKNGNEPEQYISYICYERGLV